MSLRDAFEAMDTDEQRQSHEAQRLYELIAGQWVSSTVRAVAELGVMDALADGPRTPAELAAATGADPGGLARLLRVGRSLGLLRVSGDTVEATTMGTLLGSDAAGSLRSLAMLQGTPAIWALWGSLPDAVRAGRTQAAEVLDHPYFEYLSQDPAEAQIFHSAMSNLTALVEADARRVVDVPGPTRIADLGGGSGTFLKALLQANPATTGTVVERPSVLDAARSVGAAAGLGERLQVSEGDFFTAVPEADLYVLKLILHDWSDEECVRILSTVARHARPDCRLLVVEALVRDEDGDGASLDLGALMDMTLLVMMSGRERTLAEYDALFQRSGWTRRTVRATRSIYSFIELTPDGTPE